MCCTRSRQDCADDTCFAAFAPLQLAFNVALCTGFCVRATAYPEIVAFAVKKGSEDPTLWMKVVRYFAKAGAANEMEQVLSILEKDKLLSPLQVVQLLGEDEACKVDLVRDFLVRTFTALAEEQAEVRPLLSMQPPPPTSVEPCQPAPKPYRPPLTVAIF